MVDEIANASLSHVDATASAAGARVLSGTAASACAVDATCGLSSDLLLGDELLLLICP